MPNNKGTRSAHGAGTIRKKTISKDGKTYTMWEARVTIGRDPGTGKQKQKSIYGKTQKEVREKMQAAAVAVNENEYFEPSKMTVSQWLDVWSAEYLNSVKPRTVQSYVSNIKNHINPSLGAKKLISLSAIDIQKFYNGLSDAKTGKAMSPKSVKNIHGTLHKALEKAVSLGYLKYNPADRPDLPKVERVEIKPLDDNQIRIFLERIKGHKYEDLYTLALFTGMRESEVLGLTWDVVDFENGTIIVKQQLQIRQDTEGQYVLASTKNSKWRTITPASSIMSLLRHRRAEQAKDRFAAGEVWSNPYNLVFTNEVGKNISKATLYNNFKRIAADMGIPGERFHDLRHSYAVAALRSGDDIKTVQGNLGHHSAAFTLDTYAHVTEQMKRESANRMEAFIASVKQA